MRSDSSAPSADRATPMFRHFIKSACMENLPREETLLRLGVKIATALMRLFV